MKKSFKELLGSIAPDAEWFPHISNFALLSGKSNFENQQQTNDVFTDKWARYSKSDSNDRFYEFQRKWYLTLYGFSDESDLASYLQTCPVILDAGCGLGYKSEWFASLSPQSLVIGIDYSGAALQAAHKYSGIPNLFFFQGDIAATGLLSDSVQFVSCDQVIMHTQDPSATFTELARLTSSKGGQLACYFYAKKALPRELLDDHFRHKCTELSNEQLWIMSEQLTELGRRLSDLDVSIDVPDIPSLGIKSGTMSIQRFIYWNFLKCFWNSELGLETSIVTNFDWYSPSNARRFSKEEVIKIINDNHLDILSLHSEEACYSGRFVKSES